MSPAAVPASSGDVISGRQIVFLAGTLSLSLSLTGGCVSVSRLSGDVFRGDGWLLCLGWGRVSLRFRTTGVDDLTGFNDDFFFVGV